MKKVFAVVLSLLVVFVLCSCGDTTEAPQTTDAVSNQATTTSSTVAEDEILENTTPPEDTNVCTHLWKQWVEKTKATCQTSGIKERNCLNCNTTEREKIKATDHEESDWTVEKVAKVGEDGLKYTKCIYCGKRMRQEQIPAIKEEHRHAVAQWVATKTPDCTNSGTQNGICSCGQTLETKAIAKLGHIPVTDKGVAATCTVNGLTEGSHCSVCDAVIVEQKSTDKLPHTEVVDKAVAATCTSEGLTEGSHCSVCDTVINKQKTVAKAAHTFVNGTCYCGATESLEFTLSSNSKYYILTGIGGYTGTVIKIPETYNGLPVEEIAANAFRANTSITSVRFNDAIIKIGGYAFYNCSNLSQDLNFPDSLKEIGDCAFKGCNKLPRVSLGSSMQVIGEGAFQSCSLLKTLTIPASMKKIGKYAFLGCSSMTDVYFEKTSGWICYHSNYYGGSEMGERALGYPPGACSFLVDLYSDRLWERN